MSVTRESGTVHSQAPGGDDRAQAPAPAADSATELLLGALDHVPAAVAVADHRLRWQYANPAFERATGLRSRDLLGHPVEETALAGAAPVLAQVLAGLPDPSAEGTTGLLRPGGAAAALRLRCRRVTVPGGTAGVVAVVVPADGTGTDPEEGAAARLALIEAASDEIGTTLDTDRTGSELARFVLARNLADLAAVDLLPTDHTAHIGDRVRLHRAALAARPDGDGDLSALAQPGRGVRYARDSAVVAALGTGRATDLDLSGDAGASAGPEGFRAAGAGVLLVVPLVARGRTIGVLLLARRPGPHARFTGDDRALVGDLARHAALALDNAQHYTRSQHVALDLQRALLSEPARPHPNLELATRYLPSGSTSVVGGDWYETVRLPFGRTLLVIGDVMGHGVEAAVDMSTYRSMLRYTAGMDLPPHRILRQLDTVITEDESARPATCLLALADPARGRWTLASAGHLPPALITPGRPTELVRVPTGPPLGTGLADYEQAALPLTPGQTLLLYTDGLVERRGEDIDVSLARLAGLPLPASGGLEDLLDTVLERLADQPADDDTALLAARPRTR
ncbi:SpoIIE family protein phosphatase [Kitasatospora sp. NPDC088346]|uniref:PP2C family protein-serine/threonine phosphatase n=1 Tax=Kitasatospora sp. NPDC088346 TaxID=3364073 RepID=UPI003806D489